jgi:hypothetical protein
MECRLALGVTKTGMQFATSDDGDEFIRNAKTEVVGIATSYGLAARLC